MNFLKIIFGAADPLTSLRRAVEQKRWADALTCGERVNRGPLSPEVVTQLDELLAAAGNGLAELNISEAEACLRAGDHSRAAEHFGLAAEHARDQELRERAGQSLEQMGQEPARSAKVPVATAGGCGAGCGSGPGAPPVADSAEGGELDPQTRLELILASYPDELSQRYTGLTGEFLEAFLLAHEGREEEALERFENVPPAQRDDLFYFELGALRGRLGQGAKGRQDLEQALAINPGLILADEALVSIEIADGRFGEAEKRLLSRLTDGRADGFCHGFLAMLKGRAGQVEAGIEHGLKAIELGWPDPQTVLLTASLLETLGRLDEAEALLGRLSSGGCGGGVSVYLGEFWLRHGKHPEKALESFKGALRQDQDNPRWLLRIGQAYLARGWTKEGKPLIEKALADPRLDPGLVEEGKQALNSGG